jgi:hypothetical protein
MAGLNGSGAIGSLPIGAAAIGGDYYTPVAGTLAATESGADTAAGSGKVIIAGTLSAAEVGNDTAAFSGKVVVAGSWASTETGTDTFIGVGGNQVAGVMAATETGADTAAGSGKVIIAGSLAATEAQDTFAGSGKTVNYGDLAATESGQDVFSADAGRKAGGYDYKSKKRYYVRVGDRILGFATAQEATSALAKQPTTKDEADVAPSATPDDAPTPEASPAEAEPPRPVEILPLTELLAYANAVAEQERVRAMLRRNEYEALARVYETWRDEEDVELLLVSL